MIVEDYFSIVTTTNADIFLDVGSDLLPQIMIFYNNTSEWWWQIIFLFVTKNIFAIFEAIIPLLYSIGKTYGKQGELFFYIEIIFLRFLYRLLYYLCAITHATKMMPKSASNHRFQALYSLIFYYLLQTFGQLLIYKLYGGEFVVQLFFSSYQPIR